MADSNEGDLLHGADRENKRTIQTMRSEISELGKRAKKLSELIIKESKGESEHGRSAASEIVAADLVEANSSVLEIVAASAKFDAASEIMQSTVDAERRSHVRCLPNTVGSTKILLDVGDIRFNTRISMLTEGAAEGSMLAAMFSGKYAVEQDGKDGSYFIDRDGTHFGLLLNFLRDPLKFDVPQCSEVRRALMKEAQYYQIEPLLYALQYLPVVNFRDCGGQISSEVAQPIDILKHLSRNGEGVQIRTASSAEQILQEGPMEEILGEVVQNEANFEWHCQDNSDLNNPYAPCFEFPRDALMAAEVKARALVMIDLGENMVSHSSFVAEICCAEYDNEEGEWHKLKCAVALIHEDGSSSISHNICNPCVDTERGTPLLSLHTSDPRDGYPCEKSIFFIQRDSKEKKVWARKIILMTDLTFKRRPYSPFKSFHEVKMYGLLRQIQTEEHLEWF